MVVKYTVSDDVPNRVINGIIPSSVVVSVHRTCILGDRDVSYTITALGQVAGVVASIVAFISADLASLSVALTSYNANQAIKTALDLLLGAVTLEFDI